MAVTVEFRGIMLYHMLPQRDKSLALQAVLVPETVNTVPPHGSTRDGQYFHMDGSVANGHYAGILIQPRMDQPTYHRIDGAEVQLGKAQRSGPALSPGPYPVAHMGALQGYGNAPPLELNPQARRLARIRVGWQGKKPPTLSVQDAPLPFSLEPGRAPLSPGFRLTYSGAISISIIVGGKTELVDVPDGAEVFVYNFDVKEPSAKQLREVNPPTSAFVIDHDFKWLYALVQPGNGMTLDDWAQGYLPAPLWRRERPTKKGKPEFVVLTLHVSTCFPAWI